MRNKTITIMYVFIILKAESIGEHEQRTDTKLLQELPRPAQAPRGVEGHLRAAIGGNQEAP